MNVKTSLPAALVKAAKDANIPEVAVAVFFKVLHVANQYSEQTVIENVIAVIKSGFFDEFRG